MKKNNLIRLTALFAAMVFVLCGCSGGNEAPEEEIRDFGYEALDYEKIADEIYDTISVDSLTMGSVARVTDETVLSEQYYLDLEQLNAYEVRSAEGKFGVADLVILWVKEGYGESAIEALETRKDNRIAEFVDYNVYDSYDTAVNADVYQEGELVMMLMMTSEDKTIARGIIDAYLLENEI